MKMALNLCLICLSGIVLIGLQLSWGMIFLVLGLLSVWLLESPARQDVSLILLAIGFLSLLEISPDLSNLHILVLGSSMLAIIVFIPLIVAKTGGPHLNFRINWPKWSRFHTLYLLTALILGSIIIPFYLKNTGAYLNWDVTFDPEHLIKLFVGTNAVGIWDELFFINIVFALLRRHTTLLLANLTQAVLFASFLYELGFTGWGPLMIFPFALIQGWTYHKTDSLGFVIMIHLVLDFILFLGLLYWHWV